MPAASLRDYSLTGPDTIRAIQSGLAEAAWYTCPVPKEKMRELLARRDGPAIRDTLIWFALLIGSGVAGGMLWGTWWSIIPFFIYGVLYGSTSDSRWHEAGHGTAFKTNWMNDALYEIASFMVMRESTLWRWSHTRHHSDTIIVGRDPEIFIQHPLHLPRLLLNFLGWNALVGYFHSLFIHASGRLTAGEKTFVPADDHSVIITKARLSLAIYTGVIGLAIAQGSILPLMFVGLPNLYGAWLMIIYGATQHAGLAENVLDHRLNCRTVYMNRLHRYLYWNMNYHVDHHMFPLVPYHNLPRLHELIKDDCPPAYRSIADAFREIIPTILRQAKDPTYFVRRPLPVAKSTAVTASLSVNRVADADGWISVGPSASLGCSDVLRFDHARRTYAIYRTDDKRLYATDGICTHGATHLADGLVSGELIECPKHNGRFDITNGSPKRAPACVALRTYAVRELAGTIQLNVSRMGGAALPPTHRFRVVSATSVATFIRELVLEPEPGTALPPYRPGEYFQFDIPAYPAFALSTLEVAPPFDALWRTQGVGELRAENPAPCRRNYSLASNPATDPYLRFNVRLALPPRGSGGLAGSGSAWVFRLRPGDSVSAIGPFGDFHIRPGTDEMIYLGGGAGMAPLRSHLSHLLETHRSTRRISFWYGARSRQELFYDRYFSDLAAQHPNFTFHPALSEPLPGDSWNGATGFIHAVLLRDYLATHANPTAIDYYLCGPPPMIEAATAMLLGLGVDRQRIAFDVF